METFLSDFNPAVIAAGAAAVFSVMAFYFFFNTSAKEATFRKRMASVKDHRSALRQTQRELAAARSGASGDKRNAEAMSKALKKLNLQSVLSDKDLKLRLLRAGMRDRSDLVKFVFKQVAYPPVVAAVAYFAYANFFAPEEFHLVQTLSVVLGGLMIGYILPGQQIDGATQKRQKEILRAYPDALDLMTICVESGMSVEQSFNKVSSELGPSALALSEEFQLTTAELSYLGDRRKALENLALRTNLEQVKAITSALIQAERYGTPVGQALRVISGESRFDRMARAEAKAASLPAMLTVPMMVFFIPVLFVVILGPAIIQVMEQMG